MRTLIIDDESLSRSLIRKFCERSGQIEVIGECENGFEAVKAIDEMKPDLIFLDVQMPKLSGIEVLELIAHQPKVVFSTAFDQYAVEAFEKRAIDYLLKPYLYERFEKAIQNVMQTQSLGWAEGLQEEWHKESKPQRLVIKDGDKINLIEHTEILHIDAYDDYVKVFTHEGRFLKKQTMAHLERTLPEDQFIRIHRSHIVSVDKIARVESVDKGKYQVVMKNEVRMPISRNAYPSLKERLGW